MKSSLSALEQQSNNLLFRNSQSVQSSFVSLPRSSSRLPSVFRFTLKICSGGLFLPYLPLYFQIYWMLSLWSWSVERSNIIMAYNTQPCHAFMSASYTRASSSSLDYTSFYYLSSWWILIPWNQFVQRSKQWTTAKWWSAAGELRKNIMYHFLHIVLSRVTEEETALRMTRSRSIILRIWWMYGRVGERWGWGGRSYIRPFLQVSHGIS